MTSTRFWKYYKNRNLHILIFFNTIDTLTMESGWALYVLSGQNILIIRSGRIFTDLQKSIDFPYISICTKDYKGSKEVLYYAL